MNDGFDFGIIIIGLGALAFVAGIGGYIWEFLKKPKARRALNLPTQNHKFTYSAQASKNTPSPVAHTIPSESSIIPRPVSPAATVLPAPLPWLVQAPVPPAAREEIQQAELNQETKSPTIDAPTLPQKSSEFAKSPDWAKAFPSFAKHKERYSEKLPEPSPDLPKAVKHQSPLPEFGGMCTKCGENPKVPGNDGFCKECSPLD